MEENEKRGFTVYTTNVPINLKFNRANWSAGTHLINPGEDKTKLVNMLKN